MIFLILMELVDKLKEVRGKELVLPGAGLVSAALLTYGAAEASAFLSQHIQNNVVVGGMVAGSEFVAGSVLLKYPTDYTIKNVYGINQQFSLRHPIESVKSIVKSSDRLKRDLAIFGLATCLLSGSLYVARPFIYNHQVIEGHEKKKASMRVDVPINFGKALFFNALGIYLLHKSRRHRDEKLPYQTA